MYHVAPCDVPSAGLATVSLPCLSLNPNTTANYGVQRTESLMTCVINDSDPEAVENKEGTAEEEEQRKKKREEVLCRGGGKKLKTLD